MLNRGNARAKVFHKEGDYAAFVDLLAAANERLPMRILGYVLMPNHFHLVLWPRTAGDLSRWMQWLLTRHVRRYHRHYHSAATSGRDASKPFPIEQDEHLVTVLRYVERNPLRAGLVERAQDWHWSSLAWRPKGKRPAMLAKWPIACPRGWIELRQAAADGSGAPGLATQHRPRHPFGDDRWNQRVAKRLGLESSLRPRGRPRKIKK